MADLILALSEAIDANQAILHEVTLKYQDFLNSTAKLDTSKLSVANVIYDTIKRAQRELSDTMELFDPSDWDEEDAVDNIWLQDHVDTLCSYTKQLKDISNSIIYNTKYSEEEMQRLFEDLKNTRNATDGFDYRGYYLIYHDLPETTSFNKAGSDCDALITTRKPFSKIEEMSPKRKKLLLISYARRGDNEFLKTLSYDLIKTMRLTSYEDCLVWLWQQNSRNCYDALFGSMFYYDLIKLFKRNTRKKIFYRGVNNPSPNYNEHRVILSASNDRQVAMNFALKRSNSTDLAEVHEGVIYEILPDYYLDLKADGYGVVDNEEEVLVLNWSIENKFNVS